MRKKNNKRALKPKSDNQAEYIRSTAENEIVFCIGPAGSGKTTIPVGLACEYLSENKVDKIIITRPVVESGHGLGYLPGSFKEKMHPYLIPILDEMKLYLSDSVADKYMSSGLIEIVPLEYMRGRNFHNSFMILDEAQNAPMDQIKMFVTRIGRKSKAVINGDTGQTDLPRSVEVGLDICLDSLDGIRGVGIIELTHQDIFRNRIISDILKRLE